MVTLSDRLHKEPSLPNAVNEARRERNRRRNLLRPFWRTAGAFWVSCERSFAWMLCIGLLLIIVLLLGAAYAMNVWHRSMFDSLQNHDAEAVGGLSLIYFVILGFSVALSVCQVYRAHDLAAALASVAG